MHLVSCDGHAVYKECVYKKETFCEPVAELLDDWAAYRDARTDDKVCLCWPKAPSGIPFLSASLPHRYSAYGNDDLVAY